MKGRTDIDARMRTGSNGTIDVWRSVRRATADRWTAVRGRSRIAGKETRRGAANADRGQRHVGGMPGAPDGCRLSHSACGGDEQPPPEQQKEERAGAFGAAAERRHHCRRRPRRPPRRRRAMSPAAPCDCARARCRRLRAPARASADVPAPPASAHRRASGADRPVPEWRDRASPRRGADHRATGLLEADAEPFVLERGQHGVAIGARRFAMRPAAYRPR